MGNFTKEYSNLGFYLNQLSKTKAKNYYNRSDLLQITKHQKLLCLSNQFYCLIKLPYFKEIFFSPNTSKILGICSSDISFLQFIELIQPKDQNDVLETYVNIFDKVSKTDKHIKSLDCLSTINFSLKHSSNQYLNILQQTCIYRLQQNTNESHLLFLFSDITPLHIYDSISIEDRVANRKALNLFTKRELEIIHLLSKGKSSFEIATDLKISKNTVDTHRRNMLYKSELSNTAEIISYTYS